MLYPLVVDVNCWKPSVNPRETPYITAQSTSPSTISTAASCGALAIAMAFYTAGAALHLTEPGVGYRFVTNRGSARRNNRGDTSFYLYAMRLNIALIVL